jgi:membrane fusion protein (multidrug efflux system)
MISMKMSGIRLGYLVILFVGLSTVSGCENGADSESVAEVPRNVRVLTLDKETVAEFFEISGPVAPVRGTDLSAQESGPVVALPVAKGQGVGKGKMVLELDRTILKAEKEAAKSALSLEAYNLDKIRQLHEAGKVSRIELLTAETGHAQAKARTEVLQERYDRAGIRAPFDGVLVDRYVELGELVVPGQRVARLLDPYTLKLEAYLTDAQVQWVTVGEKATIKLGQTWETASGAVSWIGFEADRMTGKFKVEIEIPNPDLKYHSGVIGRARLDKNQVTGVVAIPRGAVLPGRTGPTAFVVEGDRAVLRRLELGSYQGLMVVVKEGLKPGEQLVVRGHRDLRDGNLVLITETATAADGSVEADPVDITGQEAGSRIQNATDENVGSLSGGNVEASQ